MYIIEDSNQKKTKHVYKHQTWEKSGDTVIRHRLAVGDYAPPPPVSIDTKQDIVELAANSCGTKKEKERFEAELRLAQEMGTHLVVLVEEPYPNIDSLIPVKVQHPGGWPIPGKRLVARLYELQEHYGCEFRFCDRLDTPKIIKDIIINAEY